MNKKTYLKPEVEVVNMTTLQFLTASKENNIDPAHSDAPAMMIIPEEDSYSEYED